MILTLDCSFPKLVLLQARGMSEYNVNHLALAKDGWSGDFAKVITVEQIPRDLSTSAHYPKLRFYGED